jgi:hypothetical protein
MDPNDPGYLDYLIRLFHVDPPSEEENARLRPYAEAYIAFQRSCYGTQPPTPPKDVN